MEPRLSAFFNDSSVQIKNGLEGMLPTKDALLLGDRAGPEEHVSNLLHEMAHFVEIDDHRVLKRGWGLKVKQVTILGGEYPEPQTSQLFEREQRVIAFQFNLANALKIEIDETSQVRSLMYMPWAPGVPTDDEELYKWNKKKISGMRQQAVFNFDTFCKEWQRKVSVVKCLTLGFGAIFDDKK